MERQSHGQPLWYILGAIKTIPPLIALAKYNYDCLDRWEQVYNCHFA